MICMRFCASGFELLQLRFSVFAVQFVRGNRSFASCCDSLLTVKRVTSDRLLDFLLKRRLYFSGQELNNRSFTRVAGSLYNVSQ